MQFVRTSALFIYPSTYVHLGFYFHFPTITLCLLAKAWMS